jgi:hypothetical protein
LACRNPTRIELALAALLWSLPAHAEHPIALRWEGEACGSGELVLAEIDRLLGGAPRGDKTFEVSAIVGRRGDDWWLALQIGGPDGGERSIVGASCAELIDAAALIIAIAYDPDAVAETQRSVDAPAPEPTPDTRPPTPEPAPPPAPPPPPVPRAPLRAGIADGYDPPSVETQRVWISLAPRLMLDAGTLPRVAISIGGSAALRWYPLVATFRGAYLVPQSETLAGRSAGGDLDLWALAPGVCLTPYHTATYGHRSPLDLALDGCLELEFGEMRGEGFGVANPGSGGTAWLTPLAMVQLELSLAAPLSARALVGVGFPLLHPDFVLNNVGVVHAASPVVGRLGLEIAVVF